MNTMKKRVFALEHKIYSPVAAKWHQIRRHQDSTDEQATAAYEAEHGPIGDGNVLMRIIIDTPQRRRSTSVLGDA